jgi:hypothetical protein
MKILDTHVSAVLVADDDSHWHLRMVAPTISEEALEHPYIWYKFTGGGWAAVGRKYDWPLENEYQAAMKAVQQ